MGGPQLFEKLERLILRELKTKDNKQTMDFDLVILLIEYMG